MQVVQSVVNTKTKKYALVAVSVVVVITLVLTAILLGVYFYTKEVENVLEVGSHFCWWL